MTDERFREMAADYHERMMGATDLEMTETEIIEAALRACAKDTAIEACKLMCVGCSEGRPWRNTKPETHEIGHYCTVWGLRKHFNRY